MLALQPLAAALIIAGLGWTFLALSARARSRYNNMAFTTWLSAPGRIVSRHVEIHALGDGAGACAASFLPVLDYEYEVAGALYRGARIDLETAARDCPDAAWAELAAYRPGARVLVHFDPLKPQQAVLRLSAAPAPSAHVVAFGLCIALLGIVLFAIVLLRPALAFASN